MPRTGLSPDDLREAIVAAAEAVIRRHGIERTRLVDIARVIGVNHAMLYRHFADRVALIDAVSERWLKHLRDILERIDADGGDPAEGLKRWIVTLHRVMRDKRLADPELFHSYLLAAGDARPVAENHVALIRWQLAKRVTATMQAGSIANGNPLEITVLLYEATRSFHDPASQGRSDGGDKTDDERDRILDDLLGILIAGLRSPVPNAPAPHS